ncbi:hypothetical protein HYX04_01390 [Candidatus Woesearchaeota archaeon]|nr:hypothetical protein [Candidatus Woesearchaeota archaeon]
MSKILSFIAIPLSILITLKYFKIYDINPIIAYNISITLIGALFLIAMQVFSYITIHSFNEGTTLMGKLIKTILAIPGILYVINMFYPVNTGFDLEIIIALFLFTEGIYGLH